MITFQLHENFITLAEQAEVITWASSIKESCTERHDPPCRKSDIVDVFEPLPSIIYELRDRMETTLDLTNAQTIWRKGLNRLKYKVVIHETGADTPTHVDKCRYYPNQNGRPMFFRAVLLVQAATQGGMFTVNNIMPVNFPELSLVSYLGNDPHGITTVTQGERMVLRANWFKT